VRQVENCISYNFFLALHVHAHSPSWSQQLQSCSWWWSSPACVQVVHHLELWAADACMMLGTRPTYLTWVTNMRNLPDYAISWLHVAYRLYKHRHSRGLIILRAWKRAVSIRMSRCDEFYIVYNAIWRTELHHPHRFSIYTFHEFICLQCGPH
jgi:hypothetical protein